MIKLIVLSTLSLTDPIGDHPVDSLNPMKYVDTDIAVVKLSADSSSLYFYVEINDSGDLNRLADTTLYSGSASVSLFIDTDMDSSTGLTWGWWCLGYDVLLSVLHTTPIKDPWEIGDAFGFYRYDQSAYPVYKFELVDTSALNVEHKQHRLEGSIPLKMLDLKSDSIAVLVIVQEQLDPWLGDYAPDEDSLGTSALIYDLGLAKDGIKIDGKFDDWKDVPELRLVRVIPEDER